MRFLEITAALALALGSTPTWALDAYDQALTLQGVTFRVQCDKAAAENRLMVTPSELEIQYKLEPGEAAWQLVVEKTVSCE